MTRIYTSYPYDSALMALAYDGELEAFRVYYRDQLVAFLDYPDRSPSTVRICCSQTTAEAEALQDGWSETETLDWAAEQLNTWAEDEAEAEAAELAQDNHPYNSYEDYCEAAMPYPGALP